MSAHRMHHSPRWASIEWAAMPERQLSSVVSCRHHQGATQEDRARRAQAVALGKAINTAEAELVQRTRQYQPLESLRNLPAVPGGFQLNLYADRAGYIFALKDTLIPAGLPCSLTRAGCCTKNPPLMRPYRSVISTAPASSRGRTFFDPCASSASAPPRGMMAVMPELPEVEAVRRQLEPAMRGARIPARPAATQGLAPAVSTGVCVAARRPPDPLSGSPRQVSAGGARLRRDPADAPRHVGIVPDRSRLSTPDGGGSHERPPQLRCVHALKRHHCHVNDPRRFGVMDLLGDGPAASHAAVAAMGPEPLGPSFGAAALARALTGKRVALKVAVLDLRVVAGLGNIYASEALTAPVCRRCGALRRSRQRQDAPP